MLFILFSLFPNIWTLQTFKGFITGRNAGYSPESCSRNAHEHKTSLFTSDE